MGGMTAIGHRDEGKIGKKSTLETARVEAAVVTTAECEKGWKPPVRFR